jgi:hypothetical protein
MSDCRRDYSQAVDVDTLSRGLDSATIRILVWILGYMSFGYATGEFEVFFFDRVILIAGYRGEIGCLST